MLSVREAMKEGVETMVYVSLQKGVRPLFVWIEGHDRKTRNWLYRQIYGMAW